MAKSNKIHYIVHGILGALLLLFIILWAVCYRSSKKLRLSLNNSYDRAFYELADYVDNIDTLLSKAQLASTPAQLASVSNEIFMHAAEAKSCFGELPVQDANLEQTAKFLSQVGDYTYVLSQNMINGAEISEEEYSSLNSLNEYAAALSDSLDDIRQRIYNGEISFAERVSAFGTSAMADGSGILDDLENVEKSFDGYPSLIYDGPFSEHIENMGSYMISGAKEFTTDEAQAEAAKFLGDRASGLSYEGETTNTAIECYNFGKNDNGTHLTVSVTKKGGYILYFLETRDVAVQNYDAAAATETALRFLETRGITGMTDSYFEIKDNIATINFAWTQDGVKCYSDLIKVNVALDDGTIMGFESKGYLMNHRRRDLSNVLLTEDEARARVSTHLEVSAVSMAIIPKDSLREVLCYEFHGTYMDKNFIVYINAETGQEEDILLLIESESGILTV